MTETTMRKSLAEVGYIAYGMHAEWKNYKGKPMPTWDELPQQHIRDKWAIAAKAIAEASGDDLLTFEDWLLAREDGARRCVELRMFRVNDPPELVAEAKLGTGSAELVYATSIAKRLHDAVALLSGKLG